ncbi:MAG: DUF1963 domain-containing protein [Holosporales bacterium]|jgi:hypothetical protein|nr:DUF1963 domain-containing protein [Holosporales bacterium]
MDIKNRSLPEYKLELVPTSEEARIVQGFKWADENIGKRSKIGGEPGFIQNDDWPICSCCGKKMLFYAQLDSVGDKLCIADCGLIYVFMCFDCFETKSFVQSY